MGKTADVTSNLYEHTKQQAKAVLQNNLYKITLNGQQYKRTVPSKEFYVHQWNWDSAVVAMGLVHVDPKRAQDELRALIAGQWENGLIAHITYNPEETKYYPQAEKWRTEQFRKGEIVTSGITQPPVLAVAVQYVYDHIPDKKDAEKFLEELLPATLRYHKYLKMYRDPENCGLLTIVHPWESGTDNSPRWDSVYTHLPLDTIPQTVKDDVIVNRTDDKLGESSQRPTKEDYYRFMGLIDLYAEWGWDYKKIVNHSPFAVKDILFSSIWTRANESLAVLLEKVGRSEEAKKYSRWAEQTKEALAATWNETRQQYEDIDVSQQRYDPITESTIALFMPLFAGAVTEKHLAKILARLHSPKEFWTVYPVPSTALTSPKFELARYWRGATWPVTNLFIIEGLMRYATRSKKAKKMAEHLRKTTLAMIANHGFFEYFDPTNGAASPGRKDKTTTFGFATFSWPAAIFIYLSEQLELR